MATQLIFGVTILLVSYAGTTFALVEILMWAMKRLDVREASAKGQSRIVECQLPSELSDQTDHGLAYLPEAYMTTTTEGYQFDFAAKADCPQHSLACSA